MGRVAVVSVLVAVVSVDLVGTIAVVIVLVDLLWLEGHKVTEGGPLGTRGW